MFTVRVVVWWIYHKNTRVMWHRPQSPFGPVVTGFPQFFLKRKQISHHVDTFYHRSVWVNFLQVTHVPERIPHQDNMSDCAFTKACVESWPGWGVSGIDLSWPSLDGTPQGSHVRDSYLFVFFLVVGVVVNQCTVGVHERTNGLSHKIICVLTFWYQNLHVVLSQSQEIQRSMGVVKHGMSWARLSH
jgi:hypothetical protein